MRQPAAQHAQQRRQRAERIVAHIQGDERGRGRRRRGRQRQRRQAVVAQPGVLQRWACKQVADASQPAQAYNTKHVGWFVGSTAPKKGIPSVCMR